MAGSLLLCGEIGYAFWRYVAPWGRRVEYKPVPIPLTSVPPGSHTRVRYGPLAVIVFNRGNDTFDVLDLTCPHLGCIVKWRETEKHFECPCHDGFFDEAGAVKSGPPPLPLARIPYRVDGQVIVVGEDAGEPG